MPSVLDFTPFENGVNTPIVIFPFAIGGATRRCGLGAGGDGSAWRKLGAVGLSTTRLPSRRAGGMTLEPEHIRIIRVGDVE